MERCKRLEERRCWAELTVLVSLWGLNLGPLQGMNVSQCSVLSCSVCVFVCVCSGPGGSVWSLTDSDCRLVSSALCVLSELPSVCSPEGESRKTAQTFTC